MTSIIRPFFGYLQFYCLIVHLLKIAQLLCICAFNTVFECQLNDPTIADVKLQLNHKFNIALLKNISFRILLTGSRGIK